MIKLLIKIIVLTLISCCGKNNENLFNNVKYKENTEKKPQKILKKVSFDNKKMNDKTMSVSLKRIIDIIIKARKSKNYILEKYDNDIFKKYREYYNKKIEETIKVKDGEYSCSIQITKNPKKLGYVNGDIYGTVVCSSEDNDSMGRFEEIYLTKIGAQYYILDLLIS